MYYAIYDLEDNIICYIETFEELKKYFPNYRDRDIRRRFLNSKDKYIKIVIDNALFKVYKFE